MSRIYPLSLLAAASVLRADFIDSPLIRLSPETDLFLTARAKVEYDDNIFLNRNDTLPAAGTHYDLVPGLELQYGKDLPLTGTLSASRCFRTYFDPALRLLDDEQDAYNFSMSYDGGAALRLELGATYEETSRNSAEQAAVSSDKGTLVRSVTYGQSAKVAYVLTEKTSMSVAARRTRNRYDPTRLASPPPDFNTQGLTEAESWALPVSASYKFSEKLSAGLVLEYGESDLYNARPFGGYIDTIERRSGSLTMNWIASDKLDCELKLGILNSSYRGSGFSNQSPVYSFRVSHSLTEKLNHSLLLGQDASAGPNGNLSDSFQAVYDLNYSNSEAFRTHLGFNYTESNVLNANIGGGGRIDVRSAGIGFGVSYSPDFHWTFSFNYVLSRTLEPNTYDVNRVSAEVALRW